MHQEVYRHEPIGYNCDKPLSLALRLWDGGHTSRCTNMAVTCEPGDIFMVRFEYSHPGGAAYNVLWYQMNGLHESGNPLPSAVAAPADEIVPGLAELAYTAGAIGWKAGASAQVEMVLCSAQKVYTSPRSQLYHHSPEEVTAGDIGGEMLPLQDAPTILKYTGYGERWGLGRLFYVGVPESAQNNGVLTAGEVTNIETFAGFLDNSLSINTDNWDASFKPVLYSHVGETLRITDIVACHLSDPIIKTQRRRRPGKGI